MRSNAIIALTVAVLSTSGAAALEPRSTRAQATGIPMFACDAPPLLHEAADGIEHSGLDTLSVVHTDELAALHRLPERLLDDALKRGSGVRVHCAGGTTGPAYPVTWQLRIEQLERVRTLNGEHSLSAFEDRHTVHDPRDERRASGSLVAEIITLPRAERWRRSMDGRSLVATLNGRTGGAACLRGASPRCSVNTVVNWRLSGTDTHPELIQIRHVGGLPSDAVLWRLKR